MNNWKNTLIVTGISSLLLNSCDPEVKFRGVGVDDDTHKPLSGVGLGDSGTTAFVWPLLGKKAIDSNYIVEDTDHFHLGVGGMLDTTGPAGRFFYHTIMADEKNAMYFLKPGYRPTLVHLPVDTVYLRKR